MVGTRVTQKQNLWKTNHHSQAKNSRVDFIFHAIQNALNTYITLFLYLILKAHFFTNPVLCPIYF